MVAEFRVEENKIGGALRAGGLGDSTYSFDDGQQVETRIRFHTSVKDSSGATTTSTFDFPNALHFLKGRTR